MTPIDKAAMGLQHSIRELMLSQADRLAEAVIESMKETAREAYQAGYDKGRNEQ